MNAFTRILKFLVPPTDSDGVHPWRWAIFVCVIFLLGNAVAGRGFIGGYGAYAAAQDVQIILELQYAETIRNLHQQICTIRPKRNRTLENTLDDYQRRYAQLTSRRYPLKSCQ